MTVTAAERLGVDAAIIFADILLILEPMGIDLEFAEGEGPVIHNPVRNSDDVKRLRKSKTQGRLVLFTKRLPDASRVEAGRSVDRLFRRAVYAASYLIEGGGSKNYVHAKRLMYDDSGAWHALMSLISRALVKYLNAQIDAGAQAVQLFDSGSGVWVRMIIEFVLPHSRAVITGVKPGVPVIHFGTGTAALLS